MPKHGSCHQQSSSSRGTGRSSLIVTSEGRGLSQVLFEEHRDRAGMASQYPQPA